MTSVTAYIQASIILVLQHLQRYVFHPSRLITKSTPQIGYNFGGHTALIESSTRHTTPIKIADGDHGIVKFSELANVSVPKYATWSGRGRGRGCSTIMPLATDEVESLSYGFATIFMASLILFVVRLIVSKWRQVLGTELVEVDLMSKSVVDDIDDDVGGGGFDLIQSSTFSEIVEWSIGVDGIRSPRLTTIMGTDGAECSDEEEEGVVEVDSFQAASIRNFKKSQDIQSITRSEGGRHDSRGYCERKSTEVSGRDSMRSLPVFNESITTIAEVTPQPSLEGIKPSLTITFNDAESHLDSTEIGLTQDLPSSLPPEKLITSEIFAVHEAGCSSADLVPISPFTNNSFSPREDSQQEPATPELINLGPPSTRIKYANGVGEEFGVVARGSDSGLNIFSNHNGADFVTYHPLMELHSQLWDRQPLLVNSTSLSRSSSFISQPGSYSRGSVCLLSRCGSVSGSICGGGGGVRSFNFEFDIDGRTPSARLVSLSPYVLREDAVVGVEEVDDEEELEGAVEVEEEVEKFATDQQDISQSTMSEGSALNDYDGSGSGSVHPMHHNGNLYTFEPPIYAEY
ncbi:hypothetical protein KGF57_001779 [Candida theae]|uniref:Uncharacterized protein n=1 Tax=Candida theae TaxID=1198502 RepID=A0AAD5FZM7_9ASCO|nr:uncharacterized protein KGF57_001779 [Candida theae]KAI5961356.1 hypothetical protein KGF57_001779 [Candida theae]